MIVDEPAQGLDPEDLADFVHLVHRRAEKGRAYLIISHRLELLDAVHRRFEIRDRSLIEVSS
jgi:ABC-type multidrug transport system ATPase subunit